MQQLIVPGSVVMHGGLAVVGEMEAHRVCSPNAASSALRSSWLSSSSRSLRAPLKDAAAVFEPAVRKCTVMQAASSGVQREGLGMSQAEGNGTGKVKEAKLWGGRFEKGVTPAVERFGQSVSYDWKLYKHDLMGSRAHASMLAKQVCSNFASKHGYCSNSVSMRSYCLTRHTALIDIVETCYVPMPPCLRGRT